MNEKEKVLKYLKNIGIYDILKTKTVILRYGNSRLSMKLSKSEDLVFDAIDINSNIRLNIRHTDIFRLMMKIYLKDKLIIKNYYRELVRVIEETRYVDKKDCS
jgi:hypothetical protein